MVMCVFIMFTYAIVSSSVEIDVASAVVWSWPEHTADISSRLFQVRCLVVSLPPRARYERITLACTVMEFYISLVVLFEIRAQSG